MKFKKVQFDEKITSKIGLKEVNIDRLGQIVALVGKNGSGKSRLLKLINENFGSLMTNNDFINDDFSLEISKKNKLLSSKQSYKEELRRVKKEIIRIESQLKRYPNNANGKKKLIEFQKEIENYNLKIREINSEITKLNKVERNVNSIKEKYLKIIRHEEVKELQTAINTTAEDNVSFENLITSVSENLEYNELNSLYKTSFEFLKNLPQQLVKDKLYNFKNDKDFKKQLSSKRFSAFKEIFENIFGKELDWDSDVISLEQVHDSVNGNMVGYFTVNGMKFNYLQFSDGEKILFSYVLMFFLMSQNKNLRFKDSIIVIDEPELHLHPDAEIDLINGIRNIISKNGQLWIATHSLNIISHLNFDEIFVLKDGQIFHPSRSIQHDALKELLKIDDRIFKLSEFINSITEWTFTQFITECFINPEVIESSNKNDPQIESFINFLKTLKDEKKTFLLDFGAGKGRLVEHVLSGVNVVNKIEYCALEPDIDCHKSLISKGVKSIFSSHDDLPSETFDIIILCNVLHEIKLDNWMYILNKIINSLSNSGYLMIIEAKTLSKGENIEDIGYLLLDESELSKLFNITPPLINLANNGSQDKITSVVISSKDLKYVTIENLQNTLEFLGKNTLEKIINLRKENYENVNINSIGRKSAFYSQLHINSKIALMHINKMENQN
nr:AAA family ATPase [uncultured Draconibacterium sp.]